MSDQIHRVALLCFVFALGSIGGCANHPTFGSPEELAQEFVRSAQDWRIKDMLQCLHPSIRSHVSRTLDAYFDNLEQRDVLLGHLRRRFGDSLRTEDYESLQELVPFADYKRVDLQSLGPDAIDRKSPKVAYLRLEIPWSFCPHRAELDMGSWWLKPAPEDTDGYLWTLKVSWGLLRFQTDYFRDLSAGIRDGTINEANVRDRLARRWY